MLSQIVNEKKDEPIYVYGWQIVHEFIERIDKLEKTIEELSEKVRVLENEKNIDSK